MAVSIQIQNVMKKYEDNVVITDLTANIQSGELFTLLGPSGCGKTTLLRMIAGFNTIEHGTISFDNTVINNIPVYKRNFGMVFQNYAIFPNMTVYKNVEYGLKNKKLPKAEIKRRIDEILDAVQITQYKDRYPNKLSGGQQQRVALARAIVVQPQVLLMDEPLSNLDAKLRVEMREEILRIQRASKVTTVFVTHDQEEASSIADEVILLRLGVLQQQDSARRLYDEPVNFFAADFLGAPPINKLRGTVEHGVFRFENSEQTCTLPLRREVTDGTKAILAVRAESVVVPAGDDRLRARVLERYSINKDELSVLEIAGQQCRGFIPGEVPLALGQEIEISLKQRGVFLFDAETGERLS